MAYPGAIDSRCETGLLQGTYWRCGGESTGLTHIIVAPDETFTVGMKSWSRGQKSQIASLNCSGGVSAVISSSDLNKHTLVSGCRYSNQLSCSLPYGLGSPRLVMACLPMPEGDLFRQDSDPLPWGRTLLALDLFSNVGISKYSRIDKNEPKQAQTNFYP